MKPLVLPSYESLPCQSIMGDWEFDCKSADADSFFYKRRSLTVPCCVLCARLDDIVSRVSRSLLWTTVDCQQRFLAGGLLQQYLWGQLIDPRPSYGPNSPSLSLTPISQACPTGYRVDGNGSSECVACDQSAVTRDYFFLGFVCLVCIGVRLSVIAGTTVGKPRWVPKL